METEHDYVLGWLADETGYSLDKYGTKADDEHTEDDGEYLKQPRGDFGAPWWEHMLGEYWHRVSVLGLDTPTGRQALMKWLASGISLAASVVRLYGPLPEPGVPSGHNIGKLRPAPRRPWPTGAKCNVCQDESGGEFVGVACVPGVPMSVGWCRSCMEADAVPPLVAEHWWLDASTDGQGAGLAEWALAMQVWDSEEQAYVPLATWCKRNVTPRIRMMASAIEHYHLGAPEEVALARADQVLYGVGYMHAGKRVDPAQVLVFGRPPVAAPPLPRHNDNEEEAEHGG